MFIYTGCPKKVTVEKITVFLMETACIRFFVFKLMYTTDIERTMQKYTPLTTSMNKKFISGIRHHKLCACIYTCFPLIKAHHVARKTKVMPQFMKKKVLHMLFTKIIITKI